MLKFRVMKTIYFLRHGKSSWENAGLSDFERPLLPKGEGKTRKMGLFLLESNHLPDIIISSPARRAKQTAEIMASIIDRKLLFDDNLYPGHEEAILNTLFALRNQINSVMIVGHNPVMTTIIRELMNVNYDWLPTSGLAKACYAVDMWTDITLAVAENVQIIEPNNI